MTVIEETRKVEELIRHYEKISRFLEAETLFRARPLHIQVDGPYHIRGAFEASLSAAEFNRQGDSDIPSENP
jgi:hypothetical protein